MKCIRCDKECLDFQGSPCSNMGPFPKGITEPTIPPLNDGIVCRSYGNYGSTKFDPDSGREFIQFALCDQCLMDKGDDIVFIKYDVQLTITDYKLFKVHSSEKVEEFKAKLIDRKLDC